MKLRNIGYAAFIAATAAAFVIGSAGASEAKGKKKEAAAAAARAGDVLHSAKRRFARRRAAMKFTYANACWAAKDGAKVVSDKACPARKPRRRQKKGGKKKAARRNSRRATILTRKNGPLPAAARSFCEVSRRAELFLARRNLDRTPRAVPWSSACRGISLGPRRAWCRRDRRCGRSASPPSDGTWP